MRKKPLRSISVLLVLCLIVISAVTFPQAAATKPSIAVDDVTQVRGKQVEVGISLASNQGFATLDLELSFDSNVLKFISYTDTELIKQYGAASGYTYPAHSDNMNADAIHFSWNNDTDDNNSNNVNGKIATITFEVLSDAPVGKSLITVNQSETMITKTVESDTVPGMYVPVPLEYDCKDGSVTVTKNTSYLVGDVDGNNKVNTTDAALFMRYVNHWDGYDQKIVNWKAADVDRNEKVNTTDAAILMRYVNHWSGYDSYIIEVND